MPDIDFLYGYKFRCILGILLCGYIGENINWHYGFGLTGIFMLLGGLRFLFSKDFGEIGLLANNRNLNDDTKIKKKKKLMIIRQILR